MDLLAEDPVLQRAFDRLSRNFHTARDEWMQATAKVDDDRVLEVAEHAQAALDHLAGERWDEACAAAGLAIELAGELGRARAWREFSILVDEAAAIGQEQL